MAKKIVLGLLIMTVITWVASAQENVTGFPDMGNVFSFTWNESFNKVEQTSYFNTRTLLTPFADEGAIIPWGGNPFFAGLANTVFGIWSWTNQDIFGGALTTGLEVGGIAITVVALLSSLNSASTGDVEGGLSAVYQSIIGSAIFTGGAVFGFIRGITQYNKMMRAADYAKAYNPMNNISLVVLPTPDKGVVGSFTYSLKW